MSDPVTKNVILSFLFDLGPYDKGFVSRSAAAKKGEERAASDMQVAKGKLDELREEIAFIIDPGEGHEHKPGDIVEDSMMIGNEHYKTLEPVGKLAKLRKKWKKPFANLSWKIHNYTMRWRT